jgi:hypothetical protein
MIQCDCPQHTKHSSCSIIDRRMTIPSKKRDCIPANTQFVVSNTSKTPGIKVKSIVSYNHLGNNDGKNLSQPDMFRSKEISKSNVVDDMVSSNRLLYAEVFLSHGSEIACEFCCSCSLLVADAIHSTLNHGPLHARALARTRTCAGRASRPLRGDQICATRGRQQTCHGRVLFGNLHGRFKYNHHAQHV